MVLEADRTHATTEKLDDVYTRMCSPTRSVEITFKNSEYKRGTRLHNAPSASDVYMASIAARENRSPHVNE